MTAIATNVVNLPFGFLLPESNRRESPPNLLAASISQGKSQCTVWHPRSQRPRVLPWPAPPLPFSCVSSFRLES